MSKNKKQKQKKADEVVEITTFDHILIRDITDEKNKKEIINKRG